MNKGVIKLIPKNTRRLSTKDWRPLTLLNVSYKTLAKTLAERVLLARVVHPLQFGFLPSRNIQEAILNMIVSVDYAIASNKNFILLNLDLEKAYDRINWLFILKTLEELGCGQGFCKLVKLLFSNATTTLSLNGYLYGSIVLHRLVRQGCPLAPLLFLAITHPLDMEMS